MTSNINSTILISRIKDDADQYAVEFLPPDSFARHAYETKSFPAIRKAHTAASADAAECEKWGLTAQEWADEMDAVRVALAHDMKLDLISKGITM